MEEESVTKVVASVCATEERKVGHKQYGWKECQSVWWELNRKLGWRCGRVRGWELGPVICGVNWIRKEVRFDVCWLDRWMNELLVRYRAEVVSAHDAGGEESEVDDE